MKIRLPTYTEGLTGLCFLTLGFFAYNQSEMIQSLQKSHDEDSLLISLQEEAIEELKTGEVHISSTQAARLYPFIRLSVDQFGEKEARDLSTLVDASLPSEDFPLRNLCHYQRSLGDEVGLEGTCIFLTNTLVLTNYHVARVQDPQLFSEFYTFKNSVVRSDGKRVGAQTLAVSPLYDLALVRVPKGFSADPVTLGALSLADSSYSLLVSSPETGDVQEDSYSSFGLSSDEEYHLLSQGMLVPPSLVLPHRYEEGNSGSPLFADGKLVGLLSAVDEDNQRTFVVPVADFLRTLSTHVEENK